LINMARTPADAAAYLERIHKDTELLMDEVESEEEDEEDANEAQERVALAKLARELEEEKERKLREAQAAIEKQRAMREREKERKRLDAAAMRAEAKRLLQAAQQLETEPPKAGEKQKQKAKAAPSTTVDDPPTASSMSSGDPAANAACIISAHSAAFVARTIEARQPGLNPQLLKHIRKVVAESLFTSVVAMAAMSYWGRHGHAPSEADLQAMIGMGASAIGENASADFPVYTYINTILQHLDRRGGNYAQTWEARLSSGASGSSTLPETAADHVPVASSRPKRNPRGRQ
jgi:hypothetical protein